MDFYADPLSGSGIFGLLFVLVFLLLVGGFLLDLLTGLNEWDQNNHSPQMCVPAVLVAKRTHVSHHNRGASSTAYYVTFQVESGERMEFSVAGTEYGLLAEGDRGQLTYQGTRYLGFERV